jgi:DNA-binding transcriptional regulator YdaS (Cro superfamily)
MHMMLDMHMHGVHFAGMKLDQYLSTKKITDAAFAATAGISQSQVSRLKRGKSMPSWELASTIERVTGGKVRPKDFADAKADQAAPSQGKAA